MKDLNQVMKMTMKTSILRKEECEGCGEEVRIMEAPIMGGPYKGQMQEFKLGCKCEDLKLAAEAKELRKKADQKRMMEIFDKHSTIPPELFDATFENYIPKHQTQKEALAAAKQFVREFNKKDPKNFLLYGNYGTGKSHLALSMADALAARGLSSIFITIPSLMTKVKSTWGNRGDHSEEEVMRMLIGVDCLVLDDLGIRSNEFIDEKVFEIVNMRQGKHTVFTSNFNPRDLVSRLGKRNFSRVFNNAEIYEVLGKDERLKKFN